MIHSPMKFDCNSTHFPKGKKNTLPSLSKSVALPILTLFLFITIPPYLYDTSPSSLLKTLAPKSNESIPIFQNNLLLVDTYTNDSGISTSTGASGECDLFKGEWVPYPEGPYYTNETKCVIDDRQNCMTNGRPDTEFLKWRWKPDACELARFNATHFLEIVKGKTLGFLGDSVGRNQMESLVCLLASAAYPIDVSYKPDGRFRRWLYADYNFTIVALYSPFFVKANETDPQYNYTIKLDIDVADEKWTNQIETVDVVIIAAGQWFFRPFIFYEKGELIGCHKCSINDTKDFLPFYGYKLAFRTAFNALLSSKTYKGITFLRTFSADHFENGDYNHGGNCGRKMPFRKQEKELLWHNLEFYKTQVEEFRLAEKKGRKKGLKFKLLDTTKLMFLRPDGHPNIYGRWANKSTPPDCVHWCLPGPIDTWNEFLYHMLKMEFA